MKEYTVRVDDRGNKSWYLHGKRHREDGPAVELSNGTKAWYLNGEHLTEEEHNGSGYKSKEQHMTHEYYMKHDAFLNEMLRNQVKDVEDQEKYKGQIERQCVEMQATIDLLKATVETLCMRLKPVMADTPMRAANTELPPVTSPLGISINQYRQQTTAVIDDLVHIVESLEI